MNLTNYHKPEKVEGLSTTFISKVKKFYDVKSVAGLRNLTEEELKAVPHIGKKTIAKFARILDREGIPSYFINV